ncbi:MULTISPECIES: ankyrin repeat domain-containing protein [unclassified Candidatus Cardinium]|uniref:ankyrin repeat domain-containing protein n=1 Tax=unclassified Candidatus Cardinium TaxID=2641185 RepID=UPI001FB3C748|nr:MULTISPECIES: ankyrin repeat domain-containing protein [unclassified Candidatus Cardinium]
MKKYTYYKVGLFTGLLACNTLTSCMNTRHCVNTNQNTHRSLINPTGSDSWDRHWKAHPIQKIVTYICMGISVPAVFFGSGYGIYKLFSYDTNQSSALTSHTHALTSHTCRITGQPFMPTEWNTMTHKINKTEASLKQALKKYNELDNTDDSIDELATPINNTIQSGTQNWTNTFEVPYTISDPMVLEDQTLEVIKQTHCNLELVKCLIKEGLNPNAKHSNGVTLVTCAVANNNQEALTFLIDNGANVTAQTGANDLKEERPSPTDLAILLGHKNIVELLTSSRAGIEEVDRKGLLMDVAQLGYTDIFNLLLEKGANPCTKLTQESVNLQDTQKPVTIQDHIKIRLNSKKVAQHIAGHPKIKQWYISLNLTKDNKNDNDIQNMTNALNKAIEKWHPQKKKCPGV